MYGLRQGGLPQLLSSGVGKRGELLPRVRGRGAAREPVKMAARAIWKGTLKLERHAIPVKLYSAIQDHKVHFRLLHARDKVPVRQVMLNTESGDIVAFSDTARAYITDSRDRVMLRNDELEALKPESSRDLRVRQFLPPATIDHRWYERAYYLGPDGSPREYAALAAALQQSNREGLVQWVMRKKSYVGALTHYKGYLMLISLRYGGELVDASQLKPPQGKTLNKKELSMANQLIDMLKEEFDPTDYHDEYQEDVMKLIDSKRKGRQLKKKRPGRKRGSSDVGKALEQSIQAAKRGQAKG